MAEYKDKIGAAAGKIEFLYDPATHGIAAQISVTGGGEFRVYMIAVSMDGRHILSEIPASGIGVVAVYPKPSVTAYIQSDEMGFWGRNCPACQKYFRTTHVMGLTHCPYCAIQGPGLAFLSKEQRTYITKCYDAFARAYTGRKSTSVEIADITDETHAWHYAEVKQQFHFKCGIDGCDAETDILGEYGYCPRCGRTSARKWFAERIDKMLNRLEDTKKSFPENTPSDRRARGEIWEDLTKASVSDFEALAKHLRIMLFLFPMTPKRRKRMEGLNFQMPIAASQALTEWLDIGFFEWPGDDQRPQRRVQAADFPFIQKMVQKRHILIHNGGVVDEEYLRLSGDDQVALGERIRISSNEAKRFIECIRAMGSNLMDNVEFGFGEG